MTNTTTTPKAKKTVCTCGNFGCPKRIARGLEPFCGDISVSDTQAALIRDGLFTSYEAAVKASPVGRARWVRGGGTSGGPSLFKAVAK